MAGSIWKAMDTVAKEYREHQYLSPTHIGIECSYIKPTLAHQLMRYINSDPSTKHQKAIKP